MEPAILREEESLGELLKMAVLARRSKATCRAFACPATRRKGKPSSSYAVLAVSRNSTRNASGRFDWTTRIANASGALATTRGERLQRRDSRGTTWNRRNRTCARRKHNGRPSRHRWKRPASLSWFSRVLRLGKIEELRTQAERAQLEQKRTLEVKAKRLPLWSGDVQQIPLLQVPSAEDVDLHRARAERAEQDRTAAAAMGKELRKKQTDLAARLEAIRGGSVVPSEAELKLERQRRERGWRLVRGVWLEGRPEDADVARFTAELSPSASLAEAYEKSVGRSDDVADRLRWPRPAGSVSRQWPGRSRRR